MKWVWVPLEFCIHIDRVNESSLKDKIFNTFAFHLMIINLIRRGVEDIRFGGVFLFSGMLNILNIKEIWFCIVGWHNSRQNTETSGWLFTLITLTYLRNARVCSNLYNSLFLGLIFNTTAPSNGVNVILSTWFWIWEKKSLSFCICLERVNVSLSNNKHL